MMNSARLAGVGGNRRALPRRMDVHDRIWQSIVRSMNLPDGRTTITGATRQMKLLARTAEVGRPKLVVDSTIQFIDYIWNRVTNRLQGRRHCARILRLANEWRAVVPATIDHLKCQPLQVDATHDVWSSYDRAVTATMDRLSIPTETLLQR